MSKETKFVIVILLMMLILTSGILFLIKRGMPPPTELSDRARGLNPETIEKIIGSFKEEPSHIFFSSQDEIIVLSNSSLYNQPTHLLTFKDEKGIVYRIYTKSYAPWISCSPNGRFIIYPGPDFNPGIWTFDRVEKRARLIVPETRDGKSLLPLKPLFLDDRHFVIERVDKELMEVSFSFRNPEKYLTEEEKRRLEELEKPIMEGRWFTRREEEEWWKLYNKFLESMTRTDVEAKVGKARSLRFSHPDVEERIVDMETGEEKLLLPKGEELLSVSMDRRWLYVLNKRKKRVFKVNANDLTQRKEILGWYSPGLRISKDEPLEIGVMETRSRYRCRCYKVVNKPILSKTVFYGDGKFPKSSEVIASPDGKYSLAYGKEGLFLKKLETGEVVRIDERDVRKAVWNEKSDKIAYIASGQIVFEIWSYDISTGRKHQHFPLGKKEERIFSK